MGLASILLENSMSAISPQTEIFSFSQYLSEEEARTVAAPKKWRWMGTCFPRSLTPLKRHRHRRWMLDPTHCHTPPQRELLLVLSGTTVANLKNELYSVPPGTVFLFDHYETHGLELPPGQKDFRHLWLHLPNRNQMSTNIYSVDETGDPNDLAVKIRSDSSVQLIFDAWSACAANPESRLNRALFQSAVTTTFLEILGRPALQPTGEFETHVVDYISTYIESHLNEPLTLSRLSKLAGYNSYSFHRMFKRHKQVTLHRHIMQRRISKARKLLLEGYNVESVSESVGLSSAAVFSRFFKSQAELSPSTWRKENRFEIES